LELLDPKNIMEKPIPAVFIAYHGKHAIVEARGKGGVKLCYVDRDTWCYPVSFRGYSTDRATEPQSGDSHG
ncbi:MAG TPA: hypothetical protein VIW26_16695, partial [Gemmatimonadales bacterium]